LFCSVRHRPFSLPEKAFAAKIGGETVFVKGYKEKTAD
tara:strand:- start:1696 stop:1809 length:114 start_codon:yes stop_codon:yes gene_type:complete